MIKKNIFLTVAVFLLACIIASLFFLAQYKNTGKAHPDVKSEPFSKKQSDKFEAKKDSNAKSIQPKDAPERLLLSKEEPLSSMLLDLKKYCAEHENLEEVMYGTGNIQRMILERIKREPELLVRELRDRAAPKTYRQLLIMLASGLDEPQVKSALRGIASDNTDALGVRVFAIRAIGENVSPEDLPVIRSLLTDKADEIRCEAIAAFPKPSDSGDIQIIFQELYSANYINQIVAARALARSESDIAEEDLLKSLNSNEFNPEKIDTDRRIVRMNIVGALGNFSSGSSQSALRSVIASKGEHPNVRKAAAEALAAHPSDENALALIDVLKDASPDLAVIIAQSLVKMNAKAAVPALESKLTNSASGYEKEELEKAVSKLQLNEATKDEKST